MKTLKNLLSVLSAAAMAAGLTVMLSQTIFAAGDVEINETNFPDSNFRDWILARDYGQDGILTAKEIANVKAINVTNEDIYDLKGIEFFTALENLQCRFDYLKNLDLRKNVALNYLDCRYNELTSLDVSKNTALKSFYCSGNQLTKLDVSNKPALKVLDCSENKLTVLDVSKNTALSNLYCDYNQLKALDVSKNTALNELSCDYNLLTSLDLSKNTKLTLLQCEDNLFTSLDLSKNSALRKLSCKGAHLTSLDLSKNTSLEELRCIYTQIGKLYLAKESYEFSNFECDEEIEIIVVKDGAVAISPLNIPDENFRKWILEQEYGNDDVLTKKEIADVKEINVDLKTISDLSGIEFFTSLINLYCYDNQLTSLDLSANTALKKLDCSGNQLRALDLSKNTALESLTCYNNQLKNLEVSKNTSLKYLVCYNNKLTSLDLSMNNALENLNCTDNIIGKLYLAKESEDFDTLSCDDDVEIIVLNVSDWNYKSVVWNINKSDPSKTTATAVFECTKDGSDGYTVSEPMTVTSDISKAKCEEKGSVHYTATLPADISRTGQGIIDEKDVELSATGHSWGEWKVTKKPTLSSEGEETRVCKNDPAHKQTRKIAKLTPTPVPGGNAKLTLDKKELSLVCGSTTALKATLKGATGKISWKSSDMRIATVDANGKVTSKMAGMVTITASAAGKKATCIVTVLYKDVIKTSDFWYAPTNYLTAKGVVKGYANQTEFRPGNDCTRAQMVTFLYRLQGEPKTQSKNCVFVDVKSSDYFFKAVIWAVEKSITTGSSDHRFNPLGICTRAQTVTFLYRMAGSPSIGSAKCPFSDVKSSDYFYKAVIWAYKKKIVAGSSDGTFKPQGKCLRRQMVTFLYKYDKYVNGKG